jgi:hypothetical protein
VSHQDPKPILVSDIQSSKSKQRSSEEPGKAAIENEIGP